MVWHIWGWGKESVPSHSSVVWKFLQQWPSPGPGQKIFPGPTLKALSLSAVSFDKKRQNSKIRTRLLVRFPEPLWVGEPDYSTRPLPCWIERYPKICGLRVLKFFLFNRLLQNRVKWFAEYKIVGVSGETLTLYHVWRCDFRKWGLC